MKSRIVFFYAGIVLSALALAGYAYQDAGGRLNVKVDEEYKVCNCETCDCLTVSSVAGKCGCGNDLVTAKVTKVEKNTAYFKAAAWSKDRPFNMVGKYVCACGPTCSCKTISQKPGKCGCGSDLKMVGKESQ
ncbi:MAG: hypothetical protein H6Q05_1011 [Acidobacteria bacterium]|nr:hypothetical protein [Acidobacteriota bacterium]